MLDFSIVDAHLHVWDTDRWYYPWLDEIPELRRPFLLEDYHRATESITVEKMVFVQCEIDPEKYTEEVEWVSSLALDKDQRIRGIVSWCPLEKGDGAKPELEALADNALVKGIRRIVQFEPEVDFMLRPEFIEGVNLLRSFGFTFDLCIDYRHTNLAADFVDRCSNVPMVLDHIGKPGISKGLLDPWRREIKELAKRENLWCKFSSLATEADHETWDLETLRPYTDAVLEAFGLDRCFFAGDWPVSTLAASYSTCVETAASLASGFATSKEDLEKLFHHNAEEFYGI